MILALAVGKQVKTKLFPYTSQETGKIEVGLDAQMFNYVEF